MACRATEAVLLRLAWSRASVHTALVLLLANTCTSFPPHKKKKKSVFMMAFLKISAETIKTNISRIKTSMGLNRNTEDIVALRLFLWEELPLH